MSENKKQVGIKRLQRAVLNRPLDMHNQEDWQKLQEKLKDHWQYHHLRNPNDDPIWKKIMRRDWDSWKFDYTKLEVEWTAYEEAIGKEMREYVMNNPNCGVSGTSTL